MEKVILDEVLQSRLNGLKQQLEVCDADGHVVGHYLPNDTYLRLVYEWARAEFAREQAPDDSQNAARTWDGKSGKTTAEAIAYLERLGREAANQAAAGP